MLFLLKESGGFEEKQLLFWLVNPTFTVTPSQELVILTEVNLLVMNQKSCNDIRDVRTCDWATESEFSSEFCTAAPRFTQG